MTINERTPEIYFLNCDRLSTLSNVASDFLLIVSRRLRSHKLLLCNLTGPNQSQKGKKKISSSPHLSVVGKNQGLHKLIILLQYWKHLLKGRDKEKVERGISISKLKDQINKMKDHGNEGNEAICPPDNLF